jgi:hypothetical protein
MPTMTRPTVRFSTGTRAIALCALCASVACVGPTGRKSAPHPTGEIQAAERAKQTVNPTGEYDLSFTDDGETRSGTMVVQGTPGDYTGRIKADNRPEVAITALAASGPQVIVTADIPQGVLLIRFRMTGDSVRGDWSLRNDGGRMVGVRRAGVK